MNGMTEVDAIQYAKLLEANIKFSTQKTVVWFSTPKGRRSVEGSSFIDAVWGARELYQKETGLKI